MLPSAAPIRVLTVDDHDLLREGVVSVIQSEPDMALAGEAKNGAEAVERYRALRPDVTLMDLQMPEMNGVDAIAAIRAEFSGARIIMLTTYKGDAQALRAMKAGASGYLLKSALRNEMMDAIRTVHAGRPSIPVEIAMQIAHHAVADALSEREIEVLQCVARGSSNKDAAFRLQISEETVKGHMKHVLEKLGATDRTQAVTIALSRGIIEL